ncbi:phosphate signaling complex protein PhoU [Bacteroides propionicifaciens]|uniref:phosphate signaling complex protein PhoU n=1 Tax=Bacteroides propionicifaciens TaxID=392838 RepID=UPI00036FF8F0|nr:phosphate signaling complex protein PhoU [Bacteroides propionicifaciens]
MKPTELELQALRTETDEMWKLVLSQIEKAKLCYLSYDRELAFEIISREKRVNAYDSKIDSDCENYIALYAPVAIDLRLILSLLKIVNTLERIGDFAESIARQILDEDYPKIDTALAEELQIETVFDTVITMLMECYIAFDTENTKLSGKILATDDKVDQLYYDALPILSNYILANPEKGVYSLKTLLILRKLERMGDHCSNIVEEIVFYIDAKVLKHTNPKKSVDKQ